MDLSIIVPCHNLEHYITPLLESLKSQQTTYSVEHIFVLDDCTDNTRKVIEDFNLPNSAIMTCCVHFAGLARNIGLEQAKGDYIWFIDGDDWLLEVNAIQLLLDNIKADHANRVQMVYASENYKEYKPVMVWQYVFSREFLHGLRFSTIPVSDDVAFMNDVWTKEKLLSGYPPLRIIQQPLYYYNYGRPGSNTVLAGETEALF